MRIELTQPVDDGARHDEIASAKVNGLEVVEQAVTLTPRGNARKFSGVAVKGTCVTCSTRFSQCCCQSRRPPWKGSNNNS